MKIAVCGLIYDKYYRLLSISRKSDYNDFGLVGGKKEQNETLEEAISREVKEETGLDVIKTLLLYKNKDKNYLVYTFLVKTIGKMRENENNKEGILKFLMEDDFYDIFKGSFGDYNKRLFFYLHKKTKRIEKFQNLIVEYESKISNLQWEYTNN